MNKTMNNNKSIIISVVAISISLVTLVLFFIKVTPNSIVGTDTLLGVLAAFIGVSVTLLVGYQIYNAFEIKEKLKKVDELEAVIKTTKEDFHLLRNEQNEDRCVIMARLLFKANMPLDTFIRFHEALVFMLSTSLIKESLKWYFEELELYMRTINGDSFRDCENLQKLAERVNDFRGLFVDDSDTIKRHENYYIVKDRYEEVMNKFEIRLENIAQGIDVSSERIDGVPEN